MNRERNQVCQYADDTALILEPRIPNGLSGSNCGDDGKSISNLHGLNIKVKALGV